MQNKLTFCPIPLDFGPSGTGKTTALKCALGTLGLLKAECIVASQRRKSSVKGACHWGLMTENQEVTSAI